jgi:DnaK suppressor protein
VTDTQHPRTGSAADATTGNPASVAAKGAPIDSGRPTNSRPPSVGQRGTTSDGFLSILDTEEFEMSHTIAPVPAEPPSHSLHDTLTDRYDTAYEAWTRHDAAVQAMRDTAASAPGDKADRAAAQTQLDEQVTLADALHSQLADLATAVAHCDNGTYGVCGRCQQYIPIERLATFPAATHCVACQHPEHR